MNKEESVRWSWCHEWFGAWLAELGFFGWLSRLEVCKKSQGRRLMMASQFWRSFNLHLFLGVLCKNIIVHAWMNTKLCIDGSYKVLHLLLDTQNNQNVFVHLFTNYPPPPPPLQYGSCVISLATPIYLSERSNTCSICVTEFPLVTVTLDHPQLAPHHWTGNSLAFPSPAPPPPIPKAPQCWQPTLTTPVLPGCDNPGHIPSMTCSSSLNWQLSSCPPSFPTHPNANSQH